MLKTNELKVHVALGENIMDRVITTIEAVEIFNNLTIEQQKMAIEQLLILREKEMLLYKFREQ